MKWFEHETDAHNHPKIKQLIKEFGAEGYMVCFTTWEIIGHYGDKYLRLSLEKYPKTDFAEVLRLTEDKIEKIWQSMAKKSLLSPKHLKNNILYSSKLKERCDEYHKKLRRKSRQDTDNIGVDKNRIDNIITEYITLKGWEEQAKDPNVLKTIYKRNVKAAKDLACLNNDLEYILRGLRHLVATLKNKGLSWTLETIIAWFPDFLKQYPPEDRTPQQVKKLLNGIGTEK